MNCKPGDLAVVVRDREAPQNIGRLCEVISLAGPFGFYGPPVAREEGVEWLVKPCTTLIAWGPGFQLIDDEDICAFPDADLKPIRDAGDGAKDEMLRPLPEEAECRT